MLDHSGRTVLCYGNIYNIKQKQSDDDSNHSVQQVSLYILKLTNEYEPKCLCVIEPVHTIVSSFLINLKVNLNVLYIKITKPVFKTKKYW
jgi:hypothetical protein